MCIRKRDTHALLHIITILRHMHIDHTTQTLITSRNNYRALTPKTLCICCVPRAWLSNRRCEHLTQVICLRPFACTLARYSLSSIRAFFVQTAIHRQHIHSEHIVHANMCLCMQARWWLHSCRAGLLVGWCEFEFVLYVLYHYVCGFLRVYERKIYWHQKSCANQM